MAPTTSFPKEQIKVLLLEKIHPAAVELFEAQEFQVEQIPSALGEQELADKLRDVHVVGIRSKTQVTAKALEGANRLLAIGCFCIGTNQVDLAAATRRGAPVFNAPFSNTRSVAELILAEVVMLARKVGDRSRELHKGVWNKTATGSHEVRGKTLGIVGYGHIGSQVGVLAEAFGMTVRFFDIEKKLPMGNNRAAAELGNLLEHSDFVTLHVPATDRTRMMIGTSELAQMKPGACLLNASRGSVVDLDALASAIQSGHIGGAAVDVYPKEPKKNGAGFESPLRGVENVILTPHVGGSTEEAQEVIGSEVASSLVRLVNEGTTSGAVNFPPLDLPQKPDTHRLLNVHENVPGVMSKISQVFSDRAANIHAQVLGTNDQIGYLITDLDQDISREVQGVIRELPTSIKTRILY